MCDEVIFRGRYLHTIEDLQSALGGGEIVPNHRCSYTDDDLLPHCCLCPVDLEQTAAKNGLRLWPSSGGEGVWILSDDDSDPRKTGIAIDTVCAVWEDGLVTVRRIEDAQRQGRLIE